MTAAIALKNVTRQFALRAGRNDTSPREFTALHDVSLDIARGEFVTLVGPSGSGKTTLLDLVAGLSSPTSGQVLVNGKAVTGPSLDRAVVFQQYALFPWRTARGNVEFPLEGGGLNRSARKARAEQYLELVGLSAFADRYPHELSGGMKQRVAIARSLAYRPSILLMDEPFAALDAQTRESLQEELLRIWHATQTTVLFITHSIEEAVYLGQRAVVLTSRPGRVKAIVDIDLGDRTPDRDVRGDAVFAHHRHQLWDLLHDEVRKAQTFGHGKILPDGSETAA